MKEGSVLLAALAVAAAIAYWSDHFRVSDGVLPAAGDAPFAHQATPSQVRNSPIVAPTRERLEVHASPDASDKAAVCTELQEVIDEVDAALQVPQAPALIDQLNARRRVYLEKRMALGC